MDLIILKIDPGYKTALDDVYREVDILKKLNHSNIVKLIEIMENEENIFLVLEYAEGGEILSWDEEKATFSQKIEEKSKFFDEKFIRRVIRDLIRGLHYRMKKSRGRREGKRELYFCLFSFFI